jgi:hypothetical protein
MRRKEIDFDKQLKRPKDIFHCPSPPPLTVRDEKALSQLIRHNHKSYHNDIFKDSKDCLQIALRNHSVNFDMGLIRDGVVIKKDGLIKTNKGAVLDK